MCCAGVVPARLLVPEFSHCFEPYRACLHACPLHARSISALCCAGPHTADAARLTPPHPAAALPPPRRPAEQAEVWIVEDGEVHPWDGDFEDYKDELIREIAAEMDAQEAEEARRQAERDEKRRAAGKK